MFGSLGLAETIFILVLALLIFGPKKLPELGRTLGRGLSEFRRASNELKRSVNAELSLDEMGGTGGAKKAPGAAEAGKEAPRIAAPPAAAGADAESEETPPEAPAPEGTTPRGAPAPQPAPEPAATEASGAKSPGSE